MPNFVELSRVYIYACIYMYTYVYICRVRDIFFLWILAYMYIIQIDMYANIHRKKNTSIYLSVIAAFTFWIKTTGNNLMRTMYLLFNCFFFHLLRHPWVNKHLLCCTSITLGSVDTKTFYLLAAITNLFKIVKMGNSNKFSLIRS